MDEVLRLQQHLPLFRTCAGWTAKDLADMLEVSRQTISAWENYDVMRPGKGVRMTAIQYYAIRKLLEDEISKDLNDDFCKKEQHIIGSLLEIFVDHPDLYPSKDKEEALSRAKLLAPSIMKQPGQRSTITMVWPMLLASVITSTALITFLGCDKEH